MKNFGAHVISIKDIAQSCGVTPATVSRALNGQKGVSDALREKILSIAEEVGYKKNQLAAGLITSRTNMIGLVVPDITNPYYAFIAKGVSSIVEQHGIGMLLCNADRSATNELRFFQMLCNYKVDGVIIISVTAKKEDLLPFKNSNIKVVCVDNPISKDLSCVMNDNYSGVCDLIEHMVIVTKVKSLVVVMGYPDVYTNQQRLRACKDTLEKLGSSEILLKTFFIEPDYEGGYQVTPELLKLEPDAVFAINDTVAVGIIAYCHDHGIRVPEDLKVAGYDDIGIASMISVPLTTVHQRKFVLGQAAARQLLQEINDPTREPSKVELFPKLVVRASCGEEFERNFKSKDQSST